MKNNANYLPAEAQRFLALVLHNPDQTIWQTWSKGDDLKATGYATVSTSAEGLADAAAQGSNVGYAVARFDGSLNGTAPRNKTSIQQMGGYYQTLVAEWDDGSSQAEQINRITQAGLPYPSVIVSTGNKSLHHYWLLDQRIGMEQFEQLQQRLILALGSDPKIKQGAQVMRLPGFNHGKTGNACEVVYPPAGVPQALPYPLKQFDVLPQLPERQESAAGGGNADWFPHLPLEDQKELCTLMLERLAPEYTGDDDRMAWATCIVNSFDEDDAIEIIEEVWPVFDSGTDRDVATMVRRLQGQEHPEPRTVGSMIEEVIKDGMELREWANKGRSLIPRDVPEPFPRRLELDSKTDWQLPMCEKTLKPSQGLLFAGGVPFLYNKKKGIWERLEQTDFDLLVQEELERAILKQRVMVVQKGADGQPITDDKGKPIKEERVIEKRGAWFKNSMVGDLAALISRKNTHLPGFAKDWHKTPSVHIAFNDGSLNLKTGELEPHSMRHFARLHYNTNYKVVTQCPAELQRVIDTCYGKEWEPVLRGVIRMLIDPTMPWETCPVVVGESGSGKGSLFEHVFTKLFSPDQVGAVPGNPKDVNSPEDVANFIAGRSLALFPDVVDWGHEFPSALMQLTENGAVATRRLYSQAKANEVLHCRLAFCSTNLPSFHRGTDGTARRFLPIATRPKIDDESDHSLKDGLKTAGVLEQIALWALAMDRQEAEAVAKGAHNHAVVQEARKAFQEAADSFAEFFATEVDFDANNPSTIEVMDVYNSYKLWYADTHPGQKGVMNRNAFSAACKQRLPTKPYYIARGNKTVAGKSVRTPAVLRCLVYVNDNTFNKG